MVYKIYHNDNGDICLVSKCDFPRAETKDHRLYRVEYPLSDTKLQVGDMLAICKSGESSCLVNVHPKLVSHPRCSSCKFGRLNKEISNPKRGWQYDCSIGDPNVTHSDDFYCASALPLFDTGVDPQSKE